MLDYSLRNSHRAQHQEWIKKVRKTEAPEDTSAPELLPEAVKYWSMFNLLSSQRTVGQNGPQPLAISEVYAYGQCIELESGEYEFVLEVMVIMDRVYITHVYKQIDKARKDAESKASRKRGR